MAFVVVPHPSAEPPGALASALALATHMPVTKAARKTIIEPDHVYAIPPETWIRITGSVLTQVPRREQQGAQRPIDYFFESLALDQRASAMAVALGAPDADGVRGLQAIRDAGGIAVVRSVGASNEERETSGEALQSTNKRLKILNEELENRNDELGRLSDYLTNLLSSTTIPILMVDHALRIRHATPAARHLFNTGSPSHGIRDMRLRVGKDLEALIRRVIDTGAGGEMEVLDWEARWNVLRVRPYLTADNRVEGAVLTMLDIDQLHRAQTEADLAREFAESIVETLQIPLLVLKSDLHVRTANQAFLAAYDLCPGDLQNRTLDDIDGTHWSLPEVRSALARLSNEETLSEDLEVVQEIPAIGKRTVLIKARRVRQQGEQQILIAVHDITAHKQAERIMALEQARLKRNVAQVADALHETEEALSLSREELRALTGSLLNAQDEERRRVSRELHDDVSQNMAGLQFDIEALEQMLPADLESEKQKLLGIRDTAAQLSNDLRRIAYGLHPSTLDLLGLTVALSAYAREFSKRTGTLVEFSASGVPAELPPHISSSFYRIAQEALRNVARHARGGSAWIQLTGDATRLTLTVRNNGPGFDREAVRGRGGLGLVSMEERARLINAGFQIETGPGQGVLITVSAPLRDVD